MLGPTTKEQRAESRRRAHARRELIDGRWIATEKPPEAHGTRLVRDYYGCECARCLKAPHLPRVNDPKKRAEWRRYQLSRRVRSSTGALVATHLPARRHGTPSASDYYGCQCRKCVTAARVRRGRRADQKGKSR